MSRDIYYTCRPARNCCPPSSDLTALTSRVEDLEEEVIDLDARLDALEENESVFIIVDTEEELDAALLLGKYILIRGAGNAGVIDITSTKTIGIPGTRIWGYGWKTGSTNHLSKIRLNMPTDRTGFLITVSDVEIAGFSIQGMLALDQGTGQEYFAIELSSSVNAARAHIHDMHIYSVNRAVAKFGGVTSPYTEDLTIENCYVHTFDGNAFGFTYGLDRARIINNRLYCKLSGDTHTNPLSKGIAPHAKMRDCLIQGNYVQGTESEGIELTSIDVGGSLGGAATNTFYEMLRNRVINNTVYDTTRFGISMGFATDGQVIGNTVDSATGIGIESAGGQYEQSSAGYNNLIANNVVRNITSATTVTGIASTNSHGDIIIGNRIEDMINGTTLRVGINLYGARRALVEGNNLSGCGNMGIKDDAGLDVVSLGYNVIQNNVIRTLASESGLAVDAIVGRIAAVYIYGLRTAVVRNNVGWQPTGVNLLFLTNLTAPALVYPGDDVVATIGVGGFAFTESNLVIAYT